MTLETELETAGASLANSTNSAFISLNQESGTFLKTAQQQAVTLILDDSPTGSVTSSTSRSANQAVQTAYRTFQKAISTAEQTAVSGGTALDTTAVTAAVTALKTSLTSAVSTLGTGLTSSTYDPTATITADLTSLTSDLAAVAAPTAGSSSSAHIFARAVSSIVMQSEMSIAQAINTSVRSYNNSLL